MGTRIVETDGFEQTSGVKVVKQIFIIRLRHLKLNYKSNATILTDGGVLSVITLLSLSDI